MAMSKVFEPGIMISQTWPTACDLEGATLRAAEFIVEKGFIQAIQTVHVTNPNERQKLANLVRDAGLSYTYTFARLQKQHNLNLSSLDRHIRMKAIGFISEWLEHAREAGAQTVCVMSGPRPDVDPDRQAALDYLSESISILAEKASASPSIELLIEPGDYFADKRQTLGTVNEGLKLCNNVKDDGQDIGLCLDTAHMLLNNEPLWEFPGFEQSGIPFSPEEFDPRYRYIREFHFCNAVIESEHHLYGDKHLSFGSPGRIGEEDLDQLLDSFLGLRGRKTEPILRVYCEVLNTNPLDPYSAINLYWYVRKILEALSVSWNSPVKVNGKFSERLNQ